jgi:hypothetical protein
MAALIPSASATGSGTMTLAGPSTNSNQTVTIPDATGTMMVSGNMPAFSAYASSSQTISHATFTKVSYQTEEFDTANCFDSTTNYRFTPTVAGYYFINGSIYWNVAIGGELILKLYKNGSAYFQLNDLQSTSGTAQPYAFAGTCLTYLNGSTDYLEIYVYQSSGSSKSTGNQSIGQTVGPTYFQGYLVRSA